MKSFGSDNHSGIHPEILAEIAAANFEHVTAYGDDQYTRLAIEEFRKIFGSHVEVFFAFNGTAANCLGLLSGTHSYNSIICTDTAHINVDECGAPEKLTGCKIIALPNVNGKLTPESVQSQLHGFGFEHHSQPRFISITQTTELGTLYTTAEIRALAQLAHSNGMYLHMDGARFANAIAASGLSPREMVEGVDILSFGGTKNGMMIGEAIVILNPELAPGFKYKRKQAMQLSSKMRFISAQFTAYLRGDLWIKLATHSNAMARLLASKIGDHAQIVYPTEANGVFAVLPPEATVELLRKYHFYVWDEPTGQVRLMCSFDTTEQDVEAFAKDIICCLK